MRSVVVLPQPLGPSSVKNSPRSMSSVSSRTAVNSPKRFVTASRRTLVRGAVPRASPGPADESVVAICAPVTPPHRPI